MEYPKCVVIAAAFCRATSAALPAWSQRDAVLSALSRGRVLVVCGETGCGKSTQVRLMMIARCRLDEHVMPA